MPPQLQELGNQWLQGRDSAQITSAILTMQQELSSADPVPDPDLDLDLDQDSDPDFISSSISPASVAGLVLGNVDGAAVGGGASVLKELSAQPRSRSHSSSHSGSQSRGFHGVSLLRATNVGDGACSGAIWVCLVLTNRTVL